MKYILILLSDNTTLGEVTTNRNLTVLELCELLGIRIAETESDYAGLPDNGMYDIYDIGMEVV